MNKVFRHISISEEYIHRVMEACGYERRENGWVRDLTDKVRFHVVKDKMYKLHLDETSWNNKHYVSSNVGRVSWEQKRIMEVHKKICPPQQKKKRLPPVYAPNLLELQRKNKGGLVKRPLVSRLLDLLRK